MTGENRIVEWLLALSVLTLLAPDLFAASKNGFELDGALIPQDEILEGGPPRDGIPALSYPDIIEASEAAYMEPDDRVLGIEFGGVARAYPVRILNYHEIVNDAVGGQAVVITYCPLCGSGMAFDAKISDSAVEFGVSGLLYNSDVLLYDRKTNSLWSQIMRTAVTGPMKGSRLQQHVLAHTSWREWQDRYPETGVLSENTGYQRNYARDPYPGYSRSGRIYFPVAHTNREYHRKTLVLGLEIDGVFKAYPFPELAKGPPELADSIAGRQLTIHFDGEENTARAHDENGQELPTLIAYWFAWYAFHPDSEVFRVE